MSRRRPLFTLALALTAGLMLTGCISLFPKSDPAQLFRFTAADPAPDATPGDAVIARGPIRFDAAAATDRVLTVSGQGAAYVESVRWIAPAPVLFDEALKRTFEGTPGAPRLADRGGGLRAPFTLTLDVQSFEARYDQGEEAPPVAVVRVRAMLLRNQDRAVVADKLFEATSRASDNRQAPIAQAFETSVRKVLGDLVAWTAGK